MPGYAPIQAGTFIDGSTSEFSPMRRCGNRSTFMCRAAPIVPTSAWPSPVRCVTSMRQD